PGACPICGMALEPRLATLAESENPELMQMRRRFWVATILTLPLVVLAMGDVVPRQVLERLLSPTARVWLELALATPVVLWGGWPFFVRGRQSIANRSPNMFTLISLGVGVAFGYSVTAVGVPG